MNNTLLGNDTKNTGSGEFQIQFYATNNIFQNNIVYSTAQALFVHNFTNSDMLPATLDNNLYFGGAGAGTAIFQWNKSKFKGFASYQAATGQDASSAFADPLFQNLTLPELDIQAGSPAFAAGADLGANVIGRFDIAGNPRVANGDVTIGAYQQ